MTYETTEKRAHGSLILRVETWLLEDGLMRRPCRRERLLPSIFKAQVQPDVEYTVYRKVRGTYSDGQGGRPLWEKVMRITDAKPVAVGNTRRPVRRATRQRARRKTR